ncbi:MAG: citramalate synthase, partial [Deltaproteobacteria bacterium]|nr:citramalate synthase [Deltaproteobacteria bacterium]
AKLAAFGSTAHPKYQASEDPNLQALLASKTPVVTIFGKSWDFHVKQALKISLDKNLKLIESSIAYLKKKKVSEVIFDAEHFFDAYKENPKYARQSLEAALHGGADWIVLCETNGGALPEEVFKIVSEFSSSLPAAYGIHCHNDGELGVANSLAGVRAGATQVHGTINGIGERCGNANLVSILPNLQLKMGYKLVTASQLKKLSSLSHLVYELANMAPPFNQPFVGPSAFAHKGGIHVSAVEKNPKTYEHIAPEVVGNHRRVLLSELSGVSNLLVKAKELGLAFKKDDPVVRQLLKELKELENQGFQFEGAEASFEILMKKALKRFKPHFKLLGFKVLDQEIAEDGSFSEATILVEVDGIVEHTAALGHGPVNALDQALRKALERFYPSLKQVRLKDYKVRVLPSDSGTASKVRVLIESTDGEHTWGTVGVHENILQASWQALTDALEYHLSQVLG